MYPNGHTNSEPHVIKDCWVEDRPGKQVEHAIIESVRRAIDPENFRKHFVSFCVCRRTTSDKALMEYCKINLCSKLDSGLQVSPLVLETQADHTANRSQLSQALSLSRRLWQVRAAATARELRCFGGRFPQRQNWWCQTRFGRTIH